MSKQYTVQCGYAGYYAHTLIVVADTLEQALHKAIENANQSDDWRSLDHVSDTFVDAVREGAHDDAWNTDTPITVPERFTEAGEAPLVTITPHNAEVTRGRAHLRFADNTASVTCEIAHPPPPAPNARSSRCDTPPTGASKSTSPKAPPGCAS